MNFTLDQLLALQAIAETGTFAGAAGALNRVPSAISYNIAGLEAAIGVELFDRSRRRAELTKAGRRILEEARSVIAAAQRIERSAAELKDGWEPELHVVVDGALPMAPITRCLRRFAEPDVPTRLRVDVAFQEGVIDVIEGGHADIALCIGFDGDGDEEGYDCHPLPDLELLLVAAPEHPLCTGPVTPETREQHAELVVRDSAKRFDERHKGSFLGSRNVVFLSDFHSKRFALLDCAGYGWIPEHFIAEDLAAGRLQRLDHEPNSWTYRPRAISRSDAPVGRAGALFLAVLNEGGHASV